MDFISAEGIYLWGDFECDTTETFVCSRPCPTFEPTDQPSQFPTRNPSLKPTRSPNSFPTPEPTSNSSLPSDEQDDRNENIVDGLLHTIILGPIFLAGFIISLVLLLIARKELKSAQNKFKTLECYNVSA